MGSRLLEGLVPVFCRGQALELYLASLCVPVRDVSVEVGFEALEGLPVLAAKKLVLDVTEDLLSCAVVDAVAFA